ncbi:hypothetical protein U1839_13540 [Sphingomonas sp. RT2P30]
MSRRKEPAIPNELLDQLLAGGAASAAFEQGGLLDSLKKALTERALNAEMDCRLRILSRALPPKWLFCQIWPEAGLF